MSNMIHVIVTYTDALGNFQKRETTDQETLNYIMDNVIQHGERNNIASWKMHLRITTTYPLVHATRIMFPVPYEGDVFDMILHEN
jgi:hypothetical protein